MTDCVDCVILQAMDHEVLKEMEKALGENKTLEMLTLSDLGYDDEMMLPHDDGVTLPKEFCRHLVCGIQLNTSLSDVELNFEPNNWDCPGVGRLVYVSHILCDSVGCSV